MQTEDEQMLKEWIAQAYDDKAIGDVSFTLLYKGTRDTFDSTKMHALIDNKGPTISILKSQTDQVCGGFCNLPWSSDGAWKSDDKAFIFSVTKKTKHEQFQNKEQAVYHAGSFMIWFGYDLLIYTGCDVSASSYSNLGTTYKAPDGMAAGGDEAYSYLAG